MDTAPDVVAPDAEAPSPSRQPQRGPLPNLTLSDAFLNEWKFWQNDWSLSIKKMFSYKGEQDDMNLLFYVWPLLMEVMRLSGRRIRIWLEHDPYGHRFKHFIIEKDGRQAEPSGGHTFLLVFGRDPNMSGRKFIEAQLPVEDMPYGATTVGTSHWFFYKHHRSTGKVEKIKRFFLPREPQEVVDFLVWCLNEGEKETRERAGDEGAKQGERERDVERELEALLAELGVGVSCRTTQPARRLADGRVVGQRSE